MQIDDERGMFAFPVPRANGFSAAGKVGRGQHRSSAGRGFRNPFRVSLVRSLAARNDGALPQVRSGLRSAGNELAENRRQRYVASS